MKISAQQGSNPVQIQIERSSKKPNQRRVDAWPTMVDSKKHSQNLGSAQDQLRSTQNYLMVDATLLYGRRIAEELHLLHEEEDEQCASFNNFPEFFPELKNKYIIMKLLQWRAKINKHLSTNHQE